VSYKLPYKDKRGFCNVLISALGGDGANTVGKMLFKMGVNEFGLDGGFDAKYGSEKQGSPTSVSIRMCSQGTPVRTSGPTTAPHILVGFYPGIVLQAGHHEGLQEDGILILNSPRDPSEFRDEFELYSGKIITLDASKVVDETGSRLNMPILWVLANALDFPLDKLEEKVKQKWPKFVDSNLAAFNKAKDLIKEETFEPKEEYSDTKMSGVARGKVGYRNMPYGASLPSKNFLMQPDPIRTSAMASSPDFDEEACINCVQCLLACPDPGAIMFENQEMQGIDAAICKRCMRCVEVCPETKMGKALTRPDKEEEEV